MSEREPPVDVHIAWASGLLSAIAAAGVTDVVVSPGSRSTPLVVAALAIEGLSVRALVDERVAAFFALGQARITGRPTALVCTSGTALAHYLPAVIEASQAHVPLLILSADRPFELHHSMAPQTIDQLDVFGRYVRHRAVLGVPDLAEPAMRALRRIGAQAVGVSQYPIPGPVHLDVPFRKPLEPSRPARVEAGVAPREPGAPRLFTPALGVSDEAIARLADAVGGATRGVLVVGPRPWRAGDRLASAVAHFAARAGLPVLAEATSQLRFDPALAASSARVVGPFDALLSPVVAAVGAPDLLVEIGAPPTSGRYAEVAARHAPHPRLVLQTFGWSDPHGTATDLVWGDPAEILERVTERLPVASNGSSPWRRAWDRVAAAAAGTLAAELEAPTWTEPALARALVHRLPEGAALVVGNSSPIRDIDLATPVGGPAIAVLHQRGAAGIDGLCAGAAGAASVHGGPLVAWIGDVSALHDLGGLACLAATQKRTGRPLVVIVSANGGGRLFERLPVASRMPAAAFEEFFLTPPGVDFAALAAALSVAFRRVDSAASFAAALRSGLEDGAGAMLIEAVFDPDVARAARGALDRRIADAVERALAPEASS